MAICLPLQASTAAGTAGRSKPGGTQPSAVQAGTSAAPQASQRSPVAPEELVRAGGVEKGKVQAAAADILHDQHEKVPLRQSKGWIKGRFRTGGQAPVHAWEPRGARGPPPPCPRPRPRPPARRRPLTLSATPSRPTTRWCTHSCMRVTSCHMDLLHAVPGCSSTTCFATPAHKVVRLGGPPFSWGPSPGGPPERLCCQQAAATGHGWPLGVRQRELGGGPTLTATVSPCSEARYTVE